MSQDKEQAREYLKEMGRQADAGHTEGTIHIGTDEDMEAFLGGLVDLATEDSDFLENHCPNCDAVHEFTPIQPVYREEFDVANIVIGCPECRHTTIHATQWAPADELEEHFADVDVTEDADALDTGVEQVAIVEEHPIPVDEERARELQADNPMFESHDEVLHPDELHEQYKEVLAETYEWRIFRSRLYGQSSSVYIWNHQSGFGIRVHDGEGGFRGLVEAMMLAAEVVA